MATLPFGLTGNKGNDVVSFLLDIVLPDPSNSFFTYTIVADFLQVTGNSVENQDGSFSVFGWLQVADASIPPNFQTLIQFNIPWSEYTPKGTVTFTYPKEQIAGLGFNQNTLRSVLQAYDQTPNNAYTVANVTATWNGSGSGKTAVGSPVTLAGGHCTGYLQSESGTEAMVLGIQAVINGLPYSYPYTVTEAEKFINPYDYPNLMVTGLITHDLSKGCFLTLTDNHVLIQPNEGTGALYSYAQGDLYSTQTMLPCLIDGQFFCFDDDYPDEAGINYSGPGLPFGQVQGVNGIPFYKATGNPTIDVSFIQRSVNSNAFGFPQVIETDYFYCEPDQDFFTANGGDIVPEIPLGRCFKWPAISISHDATHSFSPNTFQVTGGAAQADGGGLYSWTVQGEADTVTGTYTPPVYLQGYRWLHVKLSASAINGNEANSAPIKLHINGKQWALSIDTSSGFDDDIDTTEPDGTPDAQDGQDSLWPLNVVTVNGVGYFVPSQERDHWGLNFVQSLMFDGMDPNFTYTLETVEGVTKQPIELEFLPAQSGYMLYQPLNTFVNGVRQHNSAIRGFRAQVDGRLSLEFPYAILEGAFDEPDNTRYLDLVAYINTIDGWNASAIPFTGFFEYASVDVADLFASGATFDGKGFVDGTTVWFDSSDSVTAYAGLIYQELNLTPGSGELADFSHYGDANYPATYHLAGHLRDRAWGVAYAKHGPAGNLDLHLEDKITGRAGGDATTRDDGWFETGSPYALSNRTYLVDGLSAQIATYGRRSDRPTYLISSCIESGKRGFFMGITTGYPIVRVWPYSDFPAEQFSQYAIDASATDASNLWLNYREHDGALMATYASQNAIQVKVSFDMAQTWLDFLGGPIMAGQNIKSYRPRTNSLTQESCFFYADPNGAVWCDIYDFYGTLLGTFPDASTSNGIGNLVADGLPDAVFLKDGAPGCKVAFTSGGVPQLFWSQDHCRTFAQVTLPG